MKIEVIAQELRQQAETLTSAADILEGAKKPVGHVVSASARRKMSIAQKARWAALRGGKNGKKAA
jgi:hypothetical protein